MKENQDGTGAVLPGAPAAEGWVLEAHVRRMLDACPAFQAEQAATRRDGWQRYIPVARRCTGDGAIEVCAVPVLPPPEARAPVPCRR